MTQSIITSRPYFSRRNFLHYAAGGAACWSMSGWLDTIAAHAAATQAAVKPKACIVLWMTGGPSHIDTFDLKPNAPAGIRGSFRPIATSVPGIEICEHLPKLAQRMHHGAIIRSMSTNEADHTLASYHLHTGYQQRAGGVAFPGLGAIVSAEIGRENPALPNFVCMGPGPRVGTASGFLGPRHSPLYIPDPAAGVQNINPRVGPAPFERQLSLLDKMEQSFFKNYQAPASQAHTTTLASAVRLMNSQDVQVFDLSTEPQRTRDAYGQGYFAQGCLLARRLVESGVPFVELNMGLGGGGWDTHQNNFPTTRARCEEIDTPMSALLDDLQDRGLLDSTLVVWMGEFGRTPKCGDDIGGGRQHYNKAWSTALFGGGIKAGQVIGKTDGTASTVIDRPVSVVDFMATVCKILGIDPAKERIPPGINRPIAVVDSSKQSHAIEELL
jgi:hypothetical protein